MVRFGLALLWMVAAGCIEPDVRTCADGLLCAGVCTPNGRCASTQQVAACDGREQFAVCSLAEVPDGVCIDSVCIPAGCGNGAIEPLEVCDDGNRAGGDGCSSDCTSNESCANGIRDFNEECDDGNTLGADGCQPDCRLARCGDGVVDTDRGEVCDDGNVNNNDQCREDCRSTELCGNSVLDFHVGEECDLGAANSDAPDSACRTSCRIARCGDGIVDDLAGESCDEGPLNSLAPDAACRPGCQPRRCGDGIRDANAGEACDDDNVVSGDGCSGDCASIEVCGNDYLDATTGEQCDAGTGISHDGCSSTCDLELPLWRPTPPSTIAGRFGANVIYAPDRDRLVVFGGADDATFPPTYFGDTWEHDGWVWTRRELDTAPSPRAGAAITYDTARGRVVLFGGNFYDGVGTNYRDTWEFDGQTWTETSPPSSPPAGDLVRLAYDRANQVSILVVDDETWTYDGTSWTFVTSAPLAGYTAGLVYSPDLAKTVLVTEIGETWLFDGSSWSQLAIVGPPPSSAVVYDTARQRVSLWSISGSSSSVWELDGGAWKQRSVTGLPTNVYDPAAAYDSLRQRTLLVGGLLSFGVSSTIYAIGATSATVLTQPAPLVGTNGSIAYDSRRARLVMISNGVTWVKEGRSAWSPRTTPSPSGALVYDRAHDQMVAYDGVETWTWDGSTWTQLAIAGPPARGLAAIVYDDAGARTVLFGGDMRDDTWAFDGITWTQVVSATRPPGRQAHAMTYDAARGKVVLVGGESTDGTWELDGSTWTRTTTTAPNRYEAVVAYDAHRRRVIMFGGTTGPALDDTWEYDGATWTPIAVPLSPAGRFGHSGVYYPPLREVVIYGGVSMSGQLTDTWVFAYLNQNSVDESCTGATTDRDGDGFAGCADPDCWYRCTPNCPPGTSCSGTEPSCGDGVCSQPLENVSLCPDDCSTP